MRKTPTKKKQRTEQQPPDDTPRVEFGQRGDQAVIWALQTMIGTVPNQRVAQLMFDDDVQSAVDLVELRNIGELSPVQLSQFWRDTLRNRLSELAARPVDRSDLIFRNTERLGSLIGLTEVEQEILAFFVECENNRGLSEIAETLPRATSNQFPNVLASCLKRNSGEVRIALKPGGLLQKIRLLRPLKFGSGASYEVNDDLNQVLLLEHVEDESLLRAFFCLSPPPTLSRSDFPHLRDNLDIALQLVRNVINRGRAGTNILIHGPPGTGKTEFARIIGHELGIQLYEVGVMDSDGDFERAERRIAGYMSCQHFLRNNSQGIVLFDEIEDVFPTERSLSRLFGRVAEPGKGAINKVLEENPAPGIWISNSIGQLDPAYLRRFDYIVQIDQPPLHVRSRIWNKHLEALEVSPHWVAEAAKNERITPADIERAASVTQLTLRPGASQSETERLLEKILDSNLKSRGCSFKVKGYPFDAASYDLALLNTDCDLRETTRVLKQQSQATLLLYGPPGCGKTAYVHHLAHVLHKTVVHKKASDLLSKWVGGTEHNISQMFQSVDPEREILLLDEADSFLQDRSGAHRSWEITQVNELLVQMESFDGIFICATNFMKALDQAAFRRFDLKVAFDYMTPEQSWKMFRGFLRTQGTKINPRAVKSLKQQLARLATLTPGDFATVRKRGRLTRQVYTADELLIALGAECAVKRDGSISSIGF